MIKIKFSEDDKQELYHERYHHPHPRVQLKIEVLWLNSLDYSHKDIRKITKISKGILYS